MSNCQQFNPPVTRRTFLGATLSIAALFSSTALSSPAAAEPYASSTGFKADKDEGTDGDLFVDNVNGSDSNSGTSVSDAMATVSAALAIAKPGHVVKIRNAGGTKYRERIAAPSGTAGNTIVLEGYGTEKPVITAAEPLTGAVACTVADEPVLGKNYASIYKVPGFAKEDIASGDPRAAFLFEGDKRLIPCMGRKPNPQYPHTERATKDWLDADETVTDGGDPNLVLGTRLPGFTDRFTAAQIENCDILFHRFPNRDARTTVASFDAASDTIYLSDQSWTAETNANKDKFILVNLLPQMRKGEWGFVDNGATVDLYFWPNDPLSVDNNIEYSRRSICVDGRGQSHLAFRSIICERSSAAGPRTDGRYAMTFGHVVGAPYATDVTLDNCWIRDTYRDGSSYAPVWVRNVNNFKMSNSTVSDAINQFGIQVQGPFWNKYEGAALGCVIDRNIVLRSDQSPVRLFGLENFMVVRNQFIDCGQAAHANKGNIYQGGHNGLWWHNYWWACSGYWTFQRSSAQFFGFNFIHGNTLDKDGRAIEDQNFDRTSKLTNLSPATGQGINGDSYFLNNMLVPWRNAATYANSLILGSKSEAAINFSVMNNILNGTGFVTEKLIANGIKTNVYTNGTPFDASDSLRPFGDVYQNTTIGDIAVKDNSPTLKAPSTAIDSLPGMDGSISLRSKFPDFDGFGMDIAGKPVDLSKPPVGPVNDPADLHRFDPIWIVRPKLTGAPTVGGSVTADDGYVMALGHTSRIYQWYLVEDVYDPRDDWTPIAGGDSATYSPVTSDVGKYLARRTTMDGVPTYSLMSAPVASSFPIGKPVSLLNPRAVDARKFAAGKWLETATLATSNKPLLVIVSTLNTAFGEIASLSITLGAEGRENGSGKELSVDPMAALRTRNQLSVATILEPGTGVQTIQVSSDDNWTNIHVTVLEVDGLAGIAVGSVTGGSKPTELSPAITTSMDNTLVLYALNRYDGTGDPITWDGGTRLIEEPTGRGHPSNSLRVSYTYEQAASSGTYSKTASWSVTHGAATSFAIELRAA